MAPQKNDAAPDFERRKPGGKLALDAAWASCKEQVDKRSWAALVPLARHCVERGIAPEAVDEVVLQALCAVEEARGSPYAEDICERVRRASHQLAMERPGVARPQVALPRGRATPRQDQWASLPETLRSDIEAWQDRASASAPSACVTERNLLLRAIAAAEAGSVAVEHLDDLLGVDAMGKILAHPSFGILGQPSQTRSKLLEFNAAYARWRGRPEIAADMEQYLIMLPRRASPVSIDEIEAAEMLARPRTLERIVARTDELVQSFSARPLRRSRQAAQTAIAIRLVLCGSHSREDLVAAVFDGPVRASEGLRRPTLRIGTSAVETTASPRTVTLIDAYYRGSTELGRPPQHLIEHRPGVPRDETTLSEAVRRFGREIDIDGLTISRLVLVTVYLLIARWQSDPDGDVSEVSIQQHLNIDQAGNFRARFGPMINESVFQQFAARIIDKNRRVSR